MEKDCSLSKSLKLSCVLLAEPVVQNVSIVFDLCMMLLVACCASHDLINIYDRLHMATEILAYIVGINCAGHIENIGNIAAGAYLNSLMSVINNFLLRSVNVPSVYNIESGLWLRG